MSDEQGAQNPEAQVASYFAQYEPKMAKLGKALRARLRARLPGLTELVYLYENQNSLVIAYSPTEYGPDGVCSLALQPDSLKLYFGQAAKLAKLDPHKLLQGSAKTVRYVDVASMADYDRAEIQALMDAAVKLSKVRLAPGAKGALIVKAEAQKKRATKRKAAR